MVPLLHIRNFFSQRESRDASDLASHFTLPSTDGTTEPKPLTLTVKYYSLRWWRGRNIGKRMDICMLSKKAQYGHIMPQKISRSWSLS